MTDQTPPAPARSVNRLIYLAFAVAALLAVWLLADLLLIVFAAILFAIAYRESAVWVADNTGLPVGAALAAVGIVFVAVIAFGVWWGGTSLAEQTGQLWTQLQSEWRSVRGYLESTAWGRQILHDVENERFLGGVDTLAGQFAGAALTTFGIVGSTLIVVAGGVYLASEPELYRRGFLMLLPIDRRQRGAEVLHKLGDMLRWWLIGRLVEILVVTAVTFAGLVALGIPLALVLAIIAGLFNFVPYIGAIAGAVPAVLVAFGQSPTQALWVALLFTAIQMVEGYLITPQIQRRTVHLPSALTIFSLTVFGTLFGLLGLLLAPALAAVLLVAVRMLYVEDFLGDRDSAPR